MREYVLDGHRENHRAEITFLECRMKADNAAWRHLCFFTREKFADFKSSNRLNLQFCETSFRNFLISVDRRFDRLAAPRVARPGSASLRPG